MSKRKHKKAKKQKSVVSPLNVWQAYPDSDMLGVRPPEENETGSEYLQYLADARGDGLFRFLIAELCEEPDMTAMELLRRIIRVQTDIADVAVMVLARTAVCAQSGQKPKSVAK
jgi:hypothetical protein